MSPLCPTKTAESIRQRLVEQVTASVRWEESMRYLLAQGFTRFIELGPGTALSGFHEAHRQDAQILNVADMASLEATSQSPRSLIAPVRIAYHLHRT